MVDRKRNSYITQIKELEEELLGLKSIQYMGGATFVNYTTKSNNLYDFTDTIAVAAHSIRVTLTHDPDKGQKNHIVRLSAFVRLDNPDVMANPAVAEVGPDRRVNVELMPEQSPPGVSTWLARVQRYGGGTPTYYLKFFFRGTINGTFSATRVWP